MIASTPAERLVAVICRVPSSLRERFAAAARAGGMSVTKALRAHMEREAGAEAQPASIGGSARKLNITLLPACSARLREEAAALGMTPARWARTALEALLIGGPRWSERERDELLRVRQAVTAISAGMSDRAAADQVTAAVARLDAALTGNMAYWRASDPSASADTLASARRGAAARRATRPRAAAPTAARPSRAEATLPP